MINFMSKEDAERAFGHSQAEYGAKFATKVATIGYFGEVREWSKNSATARAVIRYVETADKVINFVGMYGGFQCFDEGADNHANGKKEPTIYVDLHGKLNVYVRQPHETQLSRAKTRNPTMAPFDNKLALLHELGHAKQFIERPSWYAMYASNQKKAQWRDEIEARARAKWTSKLVPKTISAPVRGDMPPPPLPAFGGGANPMAQVNAILPRTTDRAAGQSWFVVIDIDNMSRHEWPICREMGLPVRMNYTDLAA